MVWIERTHLRKYFLCLRYLELLYSINLYRSIHTVSKGLEGGDSSPLVLPSTRNYSTLAITIYQSIPF